MSLGLAVGGALGSALCFAVSSVLQQRGVSRAPRGSGLHLGLLAHLVARPLWLAGLLAGVGTVSLQALALASGPLFLVQPLMVSGLLFALPVSVLLERRRPSLVEWRWAALLVVGLTVFLLAARPVAGPPLPEDARLLQTGSGAVVLALLAAVLGRGPARRHRAALLGFATGVLYGLAAALLKYAVGLAQADPLRLVTSWPGYALLVVGGSALLLNQVAYQAGPLAGALPPLAITDPLVSVVIAVTAFGERVAGSPGAVGLQIGGFLAMALAIVRLAHLASGRGPRSGGAPQRRGGETQPAP